MHIFDAIFSCLHVQTTQLCFLSNTFQIISTPMSFEIIECSDDYFRKLNNYSIFFMKKCALGKK